jgi:fructoselysine-6-P-deglycase FrlB-like protein
MNPIDVMAAEMKCQLEDLPKIQPKLAFEECVFVGSGDSYVAGLATRYFGQSSCVYPTDLLANPHLAGNKTVFFVSISGNTQANISAVEAVRKKGHRTIAITANPSSRLAGACHQVIQLNYTKLGKTAGTVGFTSSLLACIMLATKGKTGCPANLQDIYSKASETADGIDTSRPVVLLGDTFLLPAAMYFALKLNEVFGAKAFAYPLEEFCHSPLFGLKDNDAVMVFGTQEIGRRLSARLEQNGACSTFFDCSSSASIESLLYAVFLVQHMVLKTARKQGLADCYFLSNKRLLEISSDFIYGPK